MPRSAHPTALPVVVDNIPPELKALPRWLCWRYVYEHDDWRKKPVNAKTGRLAAVTSPSALARFEQAVAYLARGKADGIGFAFLATDPFTGIDLDDCRDPSTGTLLPWAQSIVESINSYTEVSPSGTGVKILVRAKLLNRFGRRKGGVEIYSAHRYFTVTGHHLVGTPARVEDRQDELTTLYTEVFRPTLLPAGMPYADPVAELSDDEVIGRAMRAPNGEKFARLWNGDISEYRSPSEADMALAGMLVYWGGRDPERIERLFERSGLASRRKWQRDDYRERTIQQAVEGVQEFRRGGLTLTRGTMINHLNRSKQEEAGPIHSRATDSRLPHGSLELSVEQGMQAIHLAEELATTHGSLPDWQASFSLARRLRTLGDYRPEQFKAAVVAFCSRSNRDFTSLWYDYFRAWDKVRLEEGDDVFEWAASRARQQPLLPNPLLGEQYNQVASIACQLAEYRQGQPFWLPVERLAALLNVSAMTVSNILKLLRREKVIAYADGGKYSFTQGRAIEYVFTWTPPEPAVAA